ncbi:MAG: LemA family protein [Planctomycetota bacterium]|nr:LemA family protein [Planctomycetota bacterium]
MEFWENVFPIADDGEAAAAMVAAVVIPTGLFFFCLVVYWKSTKRKRLIEDTPTSKVKGVFIGLNEVKGTVELRYPLESYLNESPCCWYKYSIEEHYTRTRTVTDSKGNTRTETYSGWETVDSGTDRAAFNLVDDTGKVHVLPNQAEMEGEEIFSYRCSMSDPFYYGKGPARSVSGSNHRRRFTESAIVENDEIYLLGSARMSAVAAEVEIAFDEDDDVFMISTKSESELVSRYTWRIWLTAFGIVVCGTLLPMVIHAVVNQDLENAAAATWGWMILAGVGSLGLTIFMYVILVFNGLVSTQQRLLRAWSLIDIQLKRRYDLIANLVKICQAYMQHEQETLKLVTRARAGGSTVSEMPSASEVQAGEQATQVQEVVIQRLFALKEAYPELKANQAMEDLQDAITEAEDRLAIARTFYNEATGNYNTRIRRVPEIWFASMFGYKRAAFYAVDAAQTKNVDVAALLEE